MIVYKQKIARFPAKIMMKGMFSTMKLFRPLILTLTLLTVFSVTAWANEDTKKPLHEVFQNAVVISFDYHDKVFINGQLTDIYGDYQLFQKNNRVLVPIRLMGQLVGGADRVDGNWDVVWDAQKPEEVILKSYNLNRTVKLEVDSNIMYINNEARTMDVPPQNIGGRIVLPLRSTAEALDKKVEWLEGLIIISNDAVEMQSPQTSEITAKIKARLADTRKVLDYEKRVAPVAKYGDIIYYIKNKYIENRHIQHLYKKTAGQPEQKIELPGEEKLFNSKIINHELYYFSIVSGKRLADKHIYYIDLSTGYLVRMDLAGNYKEALVDKAVKSIRFFNESIYFTADKDSGTGTGLYQYHLPGGQITELSNKPVSEFFVGTAGVYYIAEGYDLGLYKVGADGQSICLVDDSIYTALFTETGLLYTLRYLEGIYLAK